MSFFSTKQTQHVQSSDVAVFVFLLHYRSVMYCCIIVFFYYIGVQGAKPPLKPKAFRTFLYK